jgi:uncharacterized protein YuzE
LKNSIIVEKSETGDELYFRIGLGKVSNTVEITDSMYADIDAKGNLLGVEWINIKNCTKEISENSKDYSGVPEIKALQMRFPETAQKITGLLQSII